LAFCVYVSQTFKKKHKPSAKKRTENLERILLAKHTRKYLLSWSYANSLIVSVRDKVCDDDLPLRLGDKIKTNALYVITKTGEKVSVYGFRQKQSFYDKFMEKQWLVLPIFSVMLANKGYHARAV
jgi:hypothetical protein